MTWIPPHPGFPARSTNASVSPVSPKSAMPGPAIEASIPLNRPAAHWPRRRLIALLAGGLVAPAQASRPSREALARLYGRVRVVEHFPDYRVRIVEHFPDLKVRWVEHHADGPGLWIRVEHHPDFSIQFVEHFADFSIQLVDHFPGLP